MAYDFKKEEDVKEFLDNLGTEYRFSCFKEKSAEGCHLLADYMEAVKQDIKTAAKLYKTNCDEMKYPKSCFKFANFSYLGKGCEKDFKTAYDYYIKSCDLNYHDGCLHSGIILTSNDPNNNVIDKDYVKGVHYLEKSCMAGNPLGCFFESAIFINGAKGVDKDFTKAHDLSQKACDKGHIYACMNLSQMYRKGDGVEKNEDKAKFYKEKAKALHKRQKSATLNLQQHT